MDAAVDMPGAPLRPGMRVFRRRSDLFATVQEVKGEVAVVKPEWPHDGTPTEWPISELRLAGLLE